MLLESEKNHRIRFHQQAARDSGQTEQNHKYHRGKSAHMSVDYSAHDFHESRAAIDAASRDNVHVQRHGDTTVVTEYRDPYSFYWQLDKARPREEETPKPLPQTDYVIDEEIINDAVLSPDSHDSGINVEVQYSRPMRVDDAPPAKPLPFGWERHEGMCECFLYDPSGFSYYWHVDSGTIQREPPQTELPIVPMSIQPEFRDQETQADAFPTSPPVQQIVQLPAQQPIIEEHAFKQTTTKRSVNNDFSDNDDDITSKSVRFAVRSLGWTEISEEDLTPEKSSRAVNRAIVDLSTGRNDILDNVSKWGDKSILNDFQGRELIMQLDDSDLTLIDPDTMSVVHTERMQHIRVWGVGRDNGRDRDFAYVARDRSSRRFMCHVFRCDTPARTIANTLRDICKRLMLQRRPNSLGCLDYGERKLIARDTYLPTPIEEPKKTIRCHFLGVTQVPRATGIEILNEAVDRLVSQVRPDRWILANVSIAPSTIIITEVNGNQIAQCRVRYLSFLGIGRDIKHCAFIMSTSSENFMCYVFHVEPSAGPMAKTIEAACKLRYQKVLDAHASGRAPSNGKVSYYFFYKH
ncbi:phosphotyrosine interaction domain protein [Onchocerca flexuosa]|uniref:Phosphotyrosine interaction domain protein n=1 Tax=Onchocerca flexuosa TaxID=387005 RepID=A0A238BQJ1_9BILA|nr:phosphotyrosine interaction domain protein [Onchocerca flexuosa]